MSLVIKPVPQTFWQTTAVVIKGVLHVVMLGMGLLSLSCLSDSSEAHSELNFKLFANDQENKQRPEDRLEKRVRLMSK